MSKRRKDKIRKSVLVKSAVICIAVVAISFSLIPGLAAQGNGATVNVTVNAPECVKGTFDASIDVDSITGFKSGQFDLSFDSSVVNVTEVVNGSLKKEVIPVDRWEFVDGDTIRVFLNVPEVAGVNGSGNLATVCFAVAGMGGERSILSISDGLLEDREGGAILAGWADDEVTVGPVRVEVNAPEMAKAGDTFVASIDVDSIANFNSGQFDLTFDPSVVNVTAVESGCIDETEIPIGKDKWEFMGDDTIRVLPEVPGVIGVNGSGNLATISFVVLGKGGEKSILDLSNGILYNNEAEKIPAELIDDKVIVGPVKVEVNAPEFADAGGTFTATIDVVEDIANFNMAVFDLTFDSSAMNVTDVTDGSLDGTAIPITTWDFIDSNTIKVMCELSGVTGVNGSGNIATISFEVLGIGGDRSALAITNGMLANNEADEIPATWVDDKVIVGPVKVEVNAPEFADAGGTFAATIDVMEDVANFNMGVFDLTFDSSAVNVTDVTDGSLGGTAIPITSWDFIDSNTIRVMCELSGATGVNGTGNIATISFEVLGICGDRSALAITSGMLANNEAEEIPATWVDDKVIVGPVKVEVNAPEFADAGGTFTATIDVMEDVANFNMAVFDLSFDSSAVNVTDVTDGSLGGTAIPITTWDFIDSNTIKVMCGLSGATGVNGTGNIATISFEVVGNAGAKSVLEISDGMLGNNEAEEIPAVWVADDVTVK